MSDRATATVGDVGRVLVVGDSRRVVETAAMLADAFDAARVIREPSVERAVEGLADVDPDCVVCEVGADAGESPVRALADHLGPIPVVAIADRADAERALADGAADVVRPDEGGPVLAARIRNAAARSPGARDAVAEADAADRRYRSILASSAAAVFVLAADGTVVDATPGVERAFAYTPAELERRPLSQFVHPDDRVALEETIVATASGPLGASDSVTVRFDRGDGTWTLVDLDAVNRLEDPRVAGLVVTASPAAGGGPTDEPARSAVDRLADPLFALGPDWELRYWNEAARRLFEGDPEPGTVVWGLVPAPIRGTLYERFREATATGRPVRFGVTDPTTDDRLEVTVAPGEAGVTVLARPVRTDEADGVTAVVDRDRLDLLEGAVDALDDGVAIVAEGTVRFANATLSSWARGEPIVGRPVEALFDEDLAATVRERAASAVVRWGEPVRGDLSADGERRPVEVAVAPIPGDDRTLCVVRDRRRSAGVALSAVAATVDDLRSARTRPAVRRAAVEGTRDCLDADFVGWYVVDDGVLEPAAVATAADVPDVEPRRIDHGGTALEGVLEREPGTVVDGESGGGDLVPVLSRAGVRAERALAASVGDAGVVLAGAAEPLPPHALERESVASIAETASVALDRLEAGERLRECRRARSRTEAHLSRAEGLQDLERDLVATGTREAVEALLCERRCGLEGVEEGSIELVWIGRVDPGGETVTPRTWAGDDGDLLESAAIPVDPEAADPTGRAAAGAGEGEGPHVARFDPDAGATDDPGWRRALVDRGIRSALAVSIEHEGFPYGTLTVYATAPGAFDERTRGHCDHLATIAGHVIAAGERRRALLADTAIELEIAVRNDDPLTATAEAWDRRIEVRSVVPRAEGGATVYAVVPAGGADELPLWDADVDGGTGNGRETDAADPVEVPDAEADAEDVGGGDAGDGAADPNDVADTIRGVGAVRRVGQGPNGVAVELVFEASTVAEAVAEHGGRLRSVRPDEDGTRLVIDLPGTVAVGPFVRTLGRNYPGAQLVARRERDRSDRPTRALGAAVRERLSERQLRTLETAYYSGFFEWPRESTGEEVAESLGVSQPTFSRHFRTAQRKLFELLFDEPTDPE